MVKSLSHFTAEGPVKATIAKLIDGTAETKVLGLLDTAPSLRPADILTSAVSGSPLHALDVTVAAPLAIDAGVDPCATAVQRKICRYGNSLEELRAAAVQYKPLAWSFWGREGDDAGAALVTIARCDNIAPLGFPVVPEVYTMTAISCGSTAARA